MLVETTFRLGGFLSVALAALLAAGYVWAGVSVLDPGLYIASGLFLALGAIFLYVGRDAERARRDLLSLGERPSAEEGASLRPRGP